MNIEKHIAPLKDIVSVCDSVKLFILPRLSEYTINMANNMLDNFDPKTAPNVLFILAKNNEYLPFYKCDDEKKEIIVNILTQNEKLQTLIVDGNHHCHINNPEKIIGDICKFIDGEFIEEEKVVDRVIDEILVKTNRFVNKWNNF